MGLVLEAQGKSVTIFERKVDSLDEVKITEMATAALEQFPLNIRDNVRLYAYATDHKPRGEQRAVSKLRAIDIKSFKVQTIFVKAGGGPPPPPGLKEAVKKLEELIKLQRGVLSDTFREREESSSGSAPESVTAKLSSRETTIQGYTQAFRELLGSKGI